MASAKAINASTTAASPDAEKMRQQLHVLNEKYQHIRQVNTELRQQLQEFHQTERSLQELKVRSGCPIISGQQIVDC